MDGLDHHDLVVLEPRSIMAGAFKQEKEMDQHSVEEMLDKEYEIKLKGGALGYILTLLANEQHELNERMADNITDVMAVMTAAANDIVGNTLIHEVYRVAGAKMLALAMNTDEESMERLMTSKNPAEVKEAASKMMKRTPPNRNPN